MARESFDARMLQQERRVDLHVETLREITDDPEQGQRVEGELIERQVVIDLSDVAAPLSRNEFEQEGPDLGGGHVRGHGR